MSEETIHSGRGNHRGIVIAIVVLALFVLGMAMLGSGSSPEQGAEPAAATATD